MYPKVAERTSCMPEEANKQSVIFVVIEINVYDQKYPLIQRLEQRGWFPVSWNEVKFMM